MQESAMTDGRPGSRRRRWVRAVVLAVLLLTLAGPSGAETITLVVDVSAAGSIGMGPGGMGGGMMTGGGPMTYQGQPAGMAMHTSQSAAMPGMTGQVQTFQHRMLTFEFPGLGTAFAMLTGGTPWTGAKGILIGGTDALEGVTGRVSVGPAVGPDTYPFTFEFTRP